MPPLPPELAHLVEPEAQPMESLTFRLPIPERDAVYAICRAIGARRGTVLRALVLRGLAGIELDPPEAPPAPVTIG
jgi:hypothetical protein